MISEEMADEVSCFLAPVRRRFLGGTALASDKIERVAKSGRPLSLSAAAEDYLVKHIKDLDDDMMIGITTKDPIGPAY